MVAKRRHHKGGAGGVYELRCALEGVPPLDECLVLGVDPDLHHSALAICAPSESARVVSVAATSIAKKVKGPWCASLIGDEVAQALDDMEFFQLQEKLGDSRCVILVIETQQFYKGSERSNPQDLIDLGTATGALISALQYLLPIERVIPTTPRGWKGSIPKSKHQAKVYTQLGWDYTQLQTYSRPLSFGPVTPVNAENQPASKWKHMGDAIGIARWGCVKLAEERKRVERGDV